MSTKPLFSKNREYWRLVSFDVAGFAIQDNVVIPAGINKRLKKGHIALNKHNGEGYCLMYYGWKNELPKLAWFRYVSAFEFFR